ncbi:hypothetical protein F5B19DRAFT_352417 [Rostrohypoxylon terebratum]|nr:hypothetical protein F5B19DRAFT_352417 [Rostrohypoxylon terebratum]
MESTPKFHLFKDLPKELRILIWEFYFESPRLHVIHPAPESESVNAAKEALTYICTVLEPPTNVIIQNALPPSPLISREAHEVFLWSKRTWTPISFSKDFSESVASSRTRLPHSFGYLTTKRSGPRPDERPVYVDWSRDMLYICTTHSEQAFWSLRSIPWRSEIRKLALLVPHIGLAGAIPFGPSAPIREVLDYMLGLEELFIVLIPQAGTHRSPAASEAIAGIRRDIYGFVPYRIYLNKAGIATNHMLYNRTFMLIQEAMAGAPRKTKLERVVDVDCLTVPYGYYERKTYLPATKTTSA